MRGDNLDGWICVIGSVHSSCPRKVSSRSHRPNNCVLLFIAQTYWIDNLLSSITFKAAPLFLSFIPLNLQWNIEHYLSSQFAKEEKTLSQVFCFGWTIPTCPFVALSLFSLSGLASFGDSFKSKREIDRDEKERERERTEIRTGMVLRDWKDTSTCR